MNNNVFTLTDIANLIKPIVRKYGVKEIYLFGSYARGDYTEDSDIDIMILVDLADVEIEKYSKQLSWSTYDFNEEHDMDIKPIAKSDTNFKKWLGIYPFYTNVQEEGVELYGTA